MGLNVVTNVINSGDIYPYPQHYSEQFKKRTGTNIIGSCSLFGSSGPFFGC
jgi:hypothetical protein